MRFESQTPPQYDHIDRITDCSTRYGQAPAVALAWDWPREDAALSLGYTQDLATLPIVRAWHKHMG